MSQVQDDDFGGGLGVFDPPGITAGAADDAAFKAEYASHAAVLSARGITEAQYVQSRRIDEGLASLVIGSGAATK